MVWQMQKSFLYVYRVWRLYLLAAVVAVFAPIAILAPAEDDAALAAPQWFDRLASSVGYICGAVAVLTLLAALTFTIARVAFRPMLTVSSEGLWIPLGRFGRNGVFVRTQEILDVQEGIWNQSPMIKIVTPSFSVPIVEDFLGSPEEFRRVADAIALARSGFQKP